MREEFGLPCDCGDGLICRWGRVDDAEELAAFNVRIHSDDPDNPHEFLADWTRDLMRGDHPTTTAADFTLVVDKNQGGRIISSMNLISQTWALEDIMFRVGRPELVGTAEEYRRRGLVRRQFAAVHAKSAARGEMVQIITGIPWYYRQFGYEMAVNLSGSRRYVFTGNKEKDEKEEKFQLRATVEADIPVLQTLYAIHTQQSLLRRVRNEAQWRYELFKAHRTSPSAREVEMIQTMDGNVMGYIEKKQWGRHYTVGELAVLPGYGLREVGLWLTRLLEQRAVEANREREEPISHITFGMGEAHPIYEALDGELEKERPPYAYFVRVPDLAAFLLHITPVLSRRLESSVMAGYNGALRLNFYQEQWQLIFEGGVLTAVTPYEPKHFFDCDAFFPERTFLQLLFGHRSFDQLDQAFVDCYSMNWDARILLRVLFPRRPSQVIELS